MELEMFLGVVSASIFLIAVGGFILKSGKRFVKRSPTIRAEVENPQELARAEAELKAEGAGTWVTIASTSTHKGFREADLQGAVAFLGANDVPATYRTSASAEGIQDFALQVAPEHLNQARALLAEFLKK